MHSLYEKASGLIETFIGAAIEVHRVKGSGLVESIYEWCLSKELEIRGIRYETQRLIKMEYKGFVREAPLRFDLMVEGCILLELKSCEQVLPKHKAQLLSYMKLMDIPIGLLLNFHEAKLVDGLHRMMLPGANLR
jgi:GxxExxY protein